MRLFSINPLAAVAYWLFLCVLCVWAVCRACFGEVATYAPNDNAKVHALGRRLFFDESLSFDRQTNRTGDISCATCHDPSLGWTDQQDRSNGIRGQVGNRNSPPVFNLEDKETNHFFWDGVTTGLDAQAERPLRNPLEMGNIRSEDVAARLNADIAYRETFEEAFGKRVGAFRGYAVKGRDPQGRTVYDKTKPIYDVYPPVTLGRITTALAVYMRGLQIDDSPWDQYVAGDKTALTQLQLDGRRVFEVVGCNQCHSNSNLRDGRFHNTGVSVAFDDPNNPDRGLGAVDQNAGRRPTRDNFFKTPTLRNLADTQPYFHNGRAQTIDEVIAHYNRGGARQDGQADINLDKRVANIAGRLDNEYDRTALRAYLLEGLRGTLPVDTPPAKQ